MTERYTHALDDDWCIIADKFEKTLYQDKDDSDNKSEGEGLETVMIKPKESPELLWLMEMYAILLISYHMRITT